MDNLSQQLPPVNDIHIVAGSFFAAEARPRIDRYQRFEIKCFVLLVERIDEIIAFVCIYVPLDSGQVFCYGL